MTTSFFNNDNVAVIARAAYRIRTPPQCENQLPVDEGGGAALRVGRAVEVALDDGASAYLRSAAAGAASDESNRDHSKYWRLGKT